MGFIFSLFLVLLNDNLYKLVSSSSPDHINVIIVLCPRSSLCGHFGWGGGFFLRPLSLVTKPAQFANVTVGCAHYPK